MRATSHPTTPARLSLAGTRVWRRGCCLVALVWSTAWLAMAQEGGFMPPPPPPAADFGSRFVVGGAEAGGAGATAGADQVRTKRQAQVQVDPDTRTLFVTTDAATNEQVQRIIQALDNPLPQALIKVLFLEVTHNDDLDLGLDLSVTRTDGRDQSVLSSLFGVAAETRGGIVSVLQNDLQGTLRAMAEVGKLNVLSRPSILARHNEEATITIGQEVPFIRNSRITEDGQTINTIEYEDVGIILTVTPRIGADGLIELDVAPEISTLTAETVPISDRVNAPVFAKRSAKTRVVVPSGRTVVIGGLMEDQVTSTVRKVPVLGNIPGLGALFRRTIISKTKTELLIFLTPTVVDGGLGLADVGGQALERTELIRRNTSVEDLRRYLEAPGADVESTP